MEDNLDNQFRASTTGISLTETSKHYLLYTAKWANFLAIVGIVFTSMAALGAIFLFISAAIIPGMALMALLYLIIVGVYVFPIIYMINFSRSMKLALQNEDSITAETAFGHLKSLFKFLGIFTIVIISIYILFFIFGMGFAAFMRPY